MKTKRNHVKQSYLPTIPNGLRSRISRLVCFNQQDSQQLIAIANSGLEDPNPIEVTVRIATAKGDRLNISRTGVINSAYGAPATYLRE